MDILHTNTHSNVYVSSIQFNNNNGKVHPHISIVQCHCLQFENHPARANFSKTQSPSLVVTIMTVACLVVQPQQQVKIKIDHTSNRTVQWTSLSKQRDERETIPVTKVRRMDHQKRILVSEQMSSIYVTNVNCLWSGGTSFYLIPLHSIQLG